MFTVQTLVIRGAGCETRDPAQCGVLSQQGEEGSVQSVYFGLEFLEASFVRMTKSLDLNTLIVNEW